MGSNPTTVRGFSLSPCEPISCLGQSLRRYYFGMFIQHFNIPELNHYICLIVLSGQTLLVIPSLVCPSVFLCLHVCLSVCLSVRLSVCLSVCLSMYVCMYVSIYLSVCLSVCLSVYKCLCVLLLQLYILVSLGLLATQYNTI